MFTEGHVRTADNHNPIIVCFHLDKTEAYAPDAEEDGSSTTTDD